MIKKYIFLILITNYTWSQKKDSITNNEKGIDEIVVSGTLKPVLRSETLVPVEIYTATFLRKNPTSNLFEALQSINGVRPQLNCNICNTGDIHINGLEGPYTMVTIDGMPIVSALSTVYGLSGIPNALIDRIEIIKGPASTLYGSEAVGGLINIITKSPQNAPLISVDFFTTSWLENNLDLGYKFQIGKKTQSLLGLNYFNYNSPIDNNHDGFTDVTLQERISIFNKWNVIRKSNKTLTLAGRFFYEDRWGGQMEWNKSYRGGTAIYGESIYTKRQEIIAKYGLPFKENINFSFSFTNHEQNSVYGHVFYLANQQISFNQLTWNKTFLNQDLLIGLAHRYQYYNDNTSATNNAEHLQIGSIFIQNEIVLNPKHKLMLAYRLDYNNNHGWIQTPRMAYRFKWNEKNSIRFNSGTGFRVVNLFTEEHAALTGSREVTINENLKPEQSINANTNYTRKIRFKDYSLLTLETSVWYTYFYNQIQPNYDTNPNAIIYQNLKGYATTKGVNLNLDYVSSFGLKAIVGATYMENYKVENNIKTRPILTEKWSANWTLSYDIPSWYISLDYTGNAYSPMRLPLLGQLDPRSPNSPWWSIQNIQLNYKKWGGFEIYGGIKNILNWTPNKNTPFLIARANDPFDQNIQYDSNGNVLATPNNPYALTFDPSYVYAPNQGRRGFFGIRYKI